MAIQKKTNASAAAAEKNQGKNSDQVGKLSARAKRKPARSGKKTAHKSVTSDAGFDSDYQPVVYGQSADDQKSEQDKNPAVSSSPSPAAAAPITSGYASPMSTPSAVSAMDAANLHKQPMSMPAPNSNITAAKPAAVDNTELIRDIKPREHPRDAAFLAPEKFGFDLKKNAVGSQAARGKWINVLIYSLSTLIILLTILLFVLTFYSGKMVNKESSNLAGAQQPATTQSQTSSAQPSATSPAPATSGYQFTISNLPSDLQSTLVNLVQAQFKDNSVTFSSSNSNLQLPAVTKDTIFVKQTNQPQTTALMNLLTQYGIKPQIQQKSDLPVAASLYFVTILSKPDLSGLTATVYNATSTSGLAKKFCATLTSYKVSNCQALNANASQTGTTVQYKNPEALFVLRRTNEFSTAKFSAAPQGQIADMKVTVGK